MKTKVEHRCMAKAKDAQAFVARMDSAKIKHIGYKTMPDLRKHRPCSQHRGKTIGAAAVQSLWDDAGTSEPESENEEMEVA